MAPAGVLGDELGLPELAGPYLVPMIFVGAAAILSWTLLRPDPYDLADETSRPDPAADASIAVSLGPCSVGRTCRSPSSRSSPARS